MKTNQIDISVIISTRNRAQVLFKIVNHLALFLYENDEIIIVDNNSTDLTKCIVSKLKSNNFRPQIKYLQEKRVGPSFARNLGLKHVINDVVAFLDDDCLVNVGWVDKIRLFFSLEINKNVILQGKIKHVFFERKVFFQDLLNLKNEYRAKVIAQNKNSNYINYINAGNFVCSRELTDSYKLFFNEENFPFIGEERELAHRLNRDGFLIKFSEELQVFHIKRNKTFLNHLLVVWKYGFSTGKLQQHFTIDNSLGKLFQKEIKENFNISFKDELSYIYSKLDMSCLKKSLIYTYLVLSEFIYQIAFFIGKNFTFKK